MQNILVNIEALRTACHSLNCAGFEVVVVASGSMWATIKADDEMCKTLSASGVHWQIDK